MRFGLVRNLFATGDPTRVSALAQAVERVCPRGSELVLADSYAALTQQFVSGALEVAWLAPALVIEAARRRALARIIATVRNNTPEYCAALMVRAESPLGSLADLRGTRVGWVDPWSTSGYLFPRKMLRAAGFDPATLFAEQRFYGTHEAVAHALARGEVDTGAMYCTLDGVAATAPRADATLHPPDEGAGGAASERGEGDATGRRAGVPWTSGMRLRALAITGAIPGDALCVATRVPELDATELCARLSGSDGAELASLLDGERFTPRALEAYAVVREALEDEWGRTSSSPPDPPRNG